MHKLVTIPEGGTIKVQVPKHRQWKEVRIPHRYSELGRGKTYRKTYRKTPHIPTHSSHEPTSALGTSETVPERATKEESETWDDPASTSKHTSSFEKEKERLKQSQKPSCGAKYIYIWHVLQAIHTFELNLNEYHNTVVAVCQHMNNERVRELSLHYTRVLSLMPYIKSMLTDSLN